ncbi:hypothetical protein D9613_000355 [Agrocybe pediades]|uniref:Zn(2)-C6 fungal-type domain-containing protein n=1 Tax=Agrocybe pediades TaxID=84607 RepID=A0A8H4R159_9AGAR|nr:hypothetical protein D9613_000355 [Agrocybe pediades]
MDSTSSDGGKAAKEKKTRRRLRLSCVECTKRRQKCDRKYPCSLCVTRGVEHLCRWESVPVARPTPARPPANALRDSASGQTDQSELIAELRKKITSLEGELERAKEHLISPYLTCSSSGCRTYATSSPSANSAENSHSPRTFTPAVDRPASFFELRKDGSEGPSHHAIIDDGTYEATSTIAQLSLAHHGEFIGRGSLLCALHSMTSRTVARFLYAKSTDCISEYGDCTTRFSKVSFVATVDDLLSHLPSMLVVETLTAAFFAEVNWRYAIPEAWFRATRTQMWSSLQQRLVSSSQINLHWLTLLFTVLASAPKSAYDEVRPYIASYTSDDFFMCAMLARRMVEDQHLNDPNCSLMVSAADGTVVSCLATPLLCDYLAARGRVSEAWKLVGQGIRNAEAVGMHRDPEWKLWQMMSAEEKSLRRRAWWGLFTADKTYSYVLGRPQMLRCEQFDVHLPSGTRPDGTKNMYYVGLNLYIELMTMLGTAIEACFNVYFPDCHVYFDLDRKFQEWADRLPHEYRLDCDMRQLRQQFPAPDLKLMAQQRYLLHTWYLVGRLKLHVTSTTGLGRAPQDPKDIQQSMEQCVIISMDIIRLQHRTYMTLFANGNIEDSPYVYPGSSWLYEGCFSLLEASVALITTMAQLRWQEKSAEAAATIDLSFNILGEVVQREEGKTRATASRALEILTTIQHQASRSFERNSPKVKADPDLLDYTALVHMNKTVGDTSVMASVYASSPQLNLQQQMGEFTSAPQLPRFSRLFDFAGYNYSMESQSHQSLGIGRDGMRRS